MSYRTEFPTDFAPPLAIVNLIHAGRITDISWGNDVSPSFLLQRDGENFILFVDHVDANAREFRGQPRFTAFPADEDGAVEGDCSEAALATDDVNEALTWIG